MCNEWKKPVQGGRSLFHSLVEDTRRVGLVGGNMCMKLEARNVVTLRCHSDDNCEYLCPDCGCKCIDTWYVCKKSDARNVVTLRCKNHDYCQYLFRFSGCKCFDAWYRCPREEYFGYSDKSQVEMAEKWIYVARPPSARSFTANFLWACWILKEGAKGCLKIVLNCNLVKWGFIMEWEDECRTPRLVQNQIPAVFISPAAAAAEEAGGRKATTAAEGGLLPATGS
ncbi:hypothetical protein JHK82_043428 [Glycine max]|nr:hypothetical protein JHK82_043428 [Glycine max]